MNAVAKKVRVMLVDDSLLALTLLKRVINKDPRLEVVATATNGVEALAMLGSSQADVVCTDYHMPRMNGLELTRAIMRQTPLPILVISVSVKGDQNVNVLNLLSAGALDVFPKPNGSPQLNEQEARALCDRIFVLSKVRAIRHFHRERPPPPGASATPPPCPPARASANLRSRRLLAIGGSTGGPQGFATLLGGLPRDYPLPVVCVQHISRGFTQSLTEWLNAQSKLKVKMAQHNEPLQAGVVYFPPDDQHLLVEAGRVLLDPLGAPVNNSRPSVDRLFDSVARTYGGDAVAVLLSGMGRDGAQGLRQLHELGAWTLAQNEDSCVVFGMPGEAVKLGAADWVLAPQDMLGLLIQAAAPITEVTP